MERKWIIVAFGDISGFSAWRRRAANQPEVAQPFLQRFYDEIQDFAKKNECLYLKYLGDGLMILKELNGKSLHHQCIGQFLLQAGRLNSRLLKIVRTCEWPAPEGFRMRASCGHVDKIMVTDPNARSRKMPEYIGYAINLAQKLLQIAPEKDFVCHESVMKALGHSRRKFRFRHIEAKDERRKGIDPEDVEGLWEIEFY